MKRLIILLFTSNSGYMDEAPNQIQEELSRISRNIPNSPPSCQKRFWTSIYNKFNDEEYLEITETQAIKYSKCAATILLFLVVFLGFYFYFVINIFTEKS
jgi:hypothetical protein